MIDAVCLSYIRCNQGRRGGGGGVNLIKAAQYLVLHPYFCRNIASQEEQTNSGLLYKNYHLLIVKCTGIEDAFCSLQI